MEDLNRGTGGVETPRLGFVNSELQVEIQVNPKTGRMVPFTAVGQKDAPVKITSIGVASRVLDHLAAALGLRLQKRDYRKQGRSVILKDPPADGKVKFTLPPKEQKDTYLIDEPGVQQDMADLWECTVLSRRGGDSLGREFAIRYWRDRDRNLQRSPDKGIFIPGECCTTSGCETAMGCDSGFNLGAAVGTIHTHPLGSGSAAAQPSPKDRELAKSGLCGEEHYIVFNSGIFAYFSDPKKQMPKRNVSLPPAHPCKQEKTIPPCPAGFLPEP